MGVPKLGLLALSWLLPLAMARSLPIDPSQGLKGRVDTGIGGLAECWNALSELQSCSSEIILFLLNGEAYLGPDCCQAIRTIAHHCWPAMLLTVGFTAEEGDILTEYCDASTPGAAGTSPPPSSPTPAARVVVSNDN